VHELYLFDHINKENGGRTAVVALLEQPACTAPAVVLVNHRWANGNVREEWLPADKNERDLRGTRATRKREDKQSYRERNVIT
jgi:hypothetical protein